MAIKHINGINYFGDEFEYYKMDDNMLDLVTKLQSNLYDINDEAEFCTHYFDLSLYKANDLNELTNIYKSLAKAYLDDGHRAEGYRKSYKRIKHINIKGDKIDRTITDIITDYKDTYLAIEFENYVKHTFNTDNYTIYDVTLYDKYIEYCPFDMFYTLIKSYVIFINGYAIILQYGTDVAA